MPNPQEVALNAFRRELNDENQHIEDALWTAVTEALAIQTPRIERLREALERSLRWIDVYEDWMGGPDFKRREEDEQFARSVLAAEQNEEQGS